MKKILYILIAMLALSSCDDFVDIVPKGKIIPSTTDDLAKIMNLNNNVGSAGTNWFFMLDDTGLSDIQYNTIGSASKNAFTWQDYIFSKLEQDGDWLNLYRVIYLCNYVIENINSFDEGKEYNKDETLARALIHRAYSYWYLLCTYADPFTSEDGLGVPMPLVSNINNQYARSTIKEVYDQILEDLEDAIELKDLRDWREYNIWPCRAAAYSLLSRIYLSKKQWSEAADYADKALKINNYLHDYNIIELNNPENPAVGIKSSILSEYNYNIAQLDREVILTRGGGSVMTAYLVSDELVNLFDKDNDLRFRYFMSDKNSAGANLGGYNMCNWQHTFCGIKIPEIYLIRAEALARMGGSSNISDALDVLNTLRKHRYDNTTYQDYTNTNQTALINEILLERRKELQLTFVRWFDLRRLNTEAEYRKDIVHTAGNQTFTLKYNSPNYTMAIPLDIMELNNKLVQNERE